MSDIHLSGDGRVGPVEGVSSSSAGYGQKGIFTVQDALDSLGGIHLKKGTQLSPELIQALYILWFSGGSNPVVLEMLGGSDKGDKGVVSIGAARASGDKIIDPKLFLLQIENQQAQICCNMLTAWNKQLHEESERIKEEQKSQTYQEWLKRNGSEGFDAWLGTLSTAEQIAIQNYPNYDRIVTFNDSLTSKLNSYSHAITTDPSSNMPFFTSAVTLGLPMRNEYTVESGDPQHRAKIVMTNISPTVADSAVTSWIGYSIVQASSTSAAASLIPSFGRTTNINVDKEFAKAFAGDLSKRVNSKGFETLASAIFVGQTEDGQSLSPKRVRELMRVFKSYVLSLGLALMYRTESSVNGIGGGITGQEFKDLVSLNMNLKGADPQMISLARQVNTLLNSVPKKDADLFIDNFYAYVDSNPNIGNWSNLRQVYGMLQFHYDAPATAA